VAVITILFPLSHCLVLFYRLHRPYARGYTRASLERRGIIYQRFARHNTRGESRVPPPRSSRNRRFIDNRSGSKSPLGFRRRDDGSLLLDLKSLRRRRRRDGAARGSVEPESQNWPSPLPPPRPPAPHVHNAARVLSDGVERGGGVLMRRILMPRVPRIAHLLPLPPRAASVPRGGAGRGAGAGRILTFARS